MLRRRLGRKRRCTDKAGFSAEREVPMQRLVQSAFLVILWADAAFAKEPIPDKLVVLTFDDSSKSHFTVARPLLKKYGFGATFFITEGFDFPSNKRDYMTWEEIAKL